jgi:hypothetical protein
VTANASRISGSSKPSRIARSICATSGWK